MKIFGLDFTSSPSKRKPLILSEGFLEDNILTIHNFVEWYDFAGFEAWLAKDDEWVAGMDFPFGQPRTLLENMNLSTDWVDYVKYFCSMSKQEFNQALKAYRDQRPEGDKEHKRATDVVAKSISPMKMYMVPVGKMFYEGAQRLLSAEINLPPLRYTQGRKTALETYPKLFSEWVGVGTYKNDQKSKQTPEYRSARQMMVSTITAPTVAERYQVNVNISKMHQKAIIDDGTGDKLDSVLCCIQAAWASLQNHYGIPKTVDAAEGWIVDPFTIS